MVRVGILAQRDQLAPKKQNWFRSARNWVTHLDAIHKTRSRREHETRMEGDMRIEGGCHCGFIKYEGDADPEKAAICHCTDCQTLSGSAFRTVVPVGSDSFRMSAGEPTIYIKTGESGNERQQAFCPKCGSPIFSASPEPGPKST